jgi:hypothetical protein
MATVLKAFLSIFILGGIAISLYAGWQIMLTANFVKTATEHIKGTFTGYDMVEVVSRSSNTSPSGNLDFEDTTSYMSYPAFEFSDKNGEKRQVTESKNHIFERFKRGQEVEIIGSVHGGYRLAGFYSLYFRDLCILIIGLGFIMIPLIFWRGFIPLIETPEGSHFSRLITDTFKEFSTSKIGPFTVSSFLKGAGIFILITIAAAVIFSAAPFIKKLHMGSDWDLFKALENKRFDEARKLILKKKGINKADEYNQCPIHLALEADRFDLVQLLIGAGADVNAKNIYGQTPLQVVARMGNMEFVKLLLKKGALLDMPVDESPPVVIAISKGHDDIARLLIESGCDLKRVYVEGDFKYTVGDITVLAKKPELTDLVRSRGGSFTKSP